MQQNQQITLNLQLLLYFPVQKELQFPNTYRILSDLSIFELLDSVTALWDGEGVGFDKVCISHGFGVLSRCLGDGLINKVRLEAVAECSLINYPHYQWLHFGKNALCHVFIRKTNCISSVLFIKLEARCPGLPVCVVRVVG